MVEALVEILLFVLGLVLWLGCLAVGSFAFILAVKSDAPRYTLDYHARLDFGERWICGMVGVLCLVIVFFLTFVLCV